MKKIGKNSIYKEESNGKLRTEKCLTKKRRKQEKQKQAKINLIEKIVV